MRVFVAIEIADRIKKDLEGIQKDLKGRGWNVKWVEVENLHLTVVFVGRVREEGGKGDKGNKGGLGLGEVEEVVARACSKVAPFRLVVGELRLIGGRVIGLEVDDDLDEFARLQRGIAEGLGLEVKRHPPHLTLGRVRKGEGIGGGKGLKGVKGVNGEINVEAITLMQSQLTSKGPIYAPLKVWKL